ncbi:MAG: hypothetical protein AAB733_04800 [Patescibacteria group bacterium]
MAEHDRPRLPLPGFGASGHSIWQLKDGVVLDDVLNAFLAHPPNDPASRAWWEEQATSIGSFTDDTDKKRQNISFSRLQSEDPTGTYIVLSVLLPCQHGAIASMQCLSFGAQASH